MNWHVSCSVGCFEDTNFLLQPNIIHNNIFIAGKANLGEVQNDVSLVHQIWRKLCVSSVANLLGLVAILIGFEVSRSKVANIKLEIKASTPSISTAHILDLFHWQILEMETNIPTARFNKSPFHNCPLRTWRGGERKVQCNSHIPICQFSEPKLCVRCCCTLGGEFPSYPWGPD